MPSTIEIKDAMQGKFNFGDIEAIDPCSIY